MLFALSAVNRFFDTLGGKLKLTIVGPVYPYRAGIAYCTTRLAEELSKVADVEVISFSRQFPKRLYPGGSDIDETLRAKTPKNARFLLDIVNPLTWLSTALKLRREKPDAVILVWWVWVWALPYRVLLSFLPKSVRVFLQCHNIGDKEPAWWKRALTDGVLRRANALVVHARTEAADARRRLGEQVPEIVTTFLPVHELGGEIPSREEARRTLHISARNVALFFGHVRPFKALDVVLEAWAKLATPDALLVVAGEAWWNSAEEYWKLAANLGLAVAGARSSAPAAPSDDHDEGGGSAAAHPYTGFAVRFDFRFIPDSEIATWFAAADVVLAPYRIEAQSGVALTAFHFARPVIASTVGGLPEVVEEGRNGSLVPPDDPAALARAIDAFFGRNDRAIMEQQAAASARKYSWEEYGRVFARLLDGKK